MEQSKTLNKLHNTLKHSKMNEKQTFVLNMRGTATAAEIKEHLEMIIKNINDDDLVNDHGIGEFESPHILTMIEVEE